MKLYRIDDFTQGESDNGPVVLGVCPGCGVQVSFERIKNGKGFWMPCEGTDSRARLYFLQRRCPSPSCRAHIFGVLRVPIAAQGGENGSQAVLEVSYPRQALEFSDKGIPKDIAECFKEALSCHAAAAFRAATVMVRRCAEMICDDLKATGKNLYARIENLRDKGLLHEGHCEALHNIRTLGNDAVHLKLKLFDQVDQRESEAALGVMKVILRNLYQDILDLRAIEDVREGDKTEEEAP